MLAVTVATFSFVEFVNQNRFLSPHSFALTLENSLSGGIEKETQCKNRVCQIYAGDCERNGQGSTAFTKWRN